MMAVSDDPCEVIRAAAREFDDCVEGESCTQTSFKRGKKAFLYVGPQRDQFKAMFKLEASMADAERLAADDPDTVQVGSTSWVTIRFSAEKPPPKRLWKKWLKESYMLAQ